MNICNDDQLLTSKNYLIQKKKKKNFQKDTFLFGEDLGMPNCSGGYNKEHRRYTEWSTCLYFLFFFFFSSQKVHVYFNVHVHCLFIIYRQFLFFCWWKSLLSFRVHTIRPNNLSLILYLKILAVNLYVLYVFNIYVNFHINQM